MNPVVTVYMPTHNRAEFVRQSVKSVLNQSFENFELIIVNDGSKDNTKQVLEEISLQDPRVRVINKPDAQGACAARNDAIAAARGRFITGLDDDDSMTVDALDVYVKSWSEEYRFLCANFVEQRRLFPSATPVIFDRDSLLKINLVGNQVFTLTSYLQASGFDPDMKAWQDYDAWVRLINDGKALKLPNELYLIAQDEGRERITASSNAKLGALQFLVKHGMNMKESLYLNWMVSDLLNRNQPLPYWLQLAAFLVGDRKRVIQYRVNSSRSLSVLKSVLVRFFR